MTKRVIEKIIEVADVVVAIILAAGVMSCIITAAWLIDNAALK